MDFGHQIIAMAAPFHVRKQVPKTLISAAVEYDHKHRFTLKRSLDMGRQSSIRNDWPAAFDYWLCLGCDLNGSGNISLPTQARATRFSLPSCGLCMTARCTQPAQLTGLEI